MSERSITSGFDDVCRGFLGAKPSVTLTTALPDRLEWRDYLSSVVDRAAANLRDARARGQKLPSEATWNLRVTPAPNDNNNSPEVQLERRIVQVDTRWCNQIPVASGLTDPTSDRKRCIDLARYEPGTKYLELVELKVKSDNALAAAIELLEYMCIYLVCRRNRDELGLANRPALAASTIRAVVLAPARYYGGDRVSERLRIHEPQIGDGLRALLTASESFSLDFMFRRFPQSFEWDHTTTTDDAVVAAMFNLEPAFTARP